MALSERALNLSALLRLLNAIEVAAMKFAKKEADSRLTRRDFVKSGAIAIVASSWLPAFDLKALEFGPRTTDTIYVCPPCGLECDKLTFGKPGTCPVCGMTLINKDERDRTEAQALAASKSPLAGDWAGVYFIGASHNAVHINFAGGPQGLKGTLDLPGQNGGFNLTSFKSTDDSFSGELSYIGRKMSFAGHLDGVHLNGSALVNSERGKLELVRVTKVELPTMRPWEGIYRAGTRLFLFESLNEAYPCSAVELPSEMIRSLFPVGPNQFIAGPALLEAQPEEQRYRFVQDATGKRKVLIFRDQHLIKATQLPLPSEEVRFKNGDVTLAGTLILPASRGPHPAIIFMHGSGGAPRISYFGFGYWLASRGIAVLKYDKRGSGQSTGTFTTYEDLAEDAVAGARMLQTRSEIDRNRIGFWG